MKNLAANKDETIMKELQLIKDKVSENFDDELLTLKELVAIKSVAEGPAGDKDGADMAVAATYSDPPFGEGVNDAFHYMLDKGRQLGFDPVNVDNFGGHLEFGEGKEIMGIAAHLDCVPEGEGWDYDPFGCEEADGKIYGRGTNDDKGPAVAALYAMKALKDLGMEPDKRVRLILGLDEETNWDGMRYYLENEEMPDFGFTPDADFPVINGEKGILVFDVAKKFAKSAAGGLEFRSFRGGEAYNMVAASARVIVKSDKKGDYDKIREKARYFEELRGHAIGVKAIGKSLELTASGVPAHGAHPEMGVNAISIMMDFLGMLDFSNEDISDFIEFYNTYIDKELNGRSFGCLLEDEVSGETILNVGMIDMDTKSGRITINIRYPISFREDDIYSGIDTVCSKYDIGIIKRENKDPLYISADSDFVKTLMQSYRDCTGDEESQPIVIGGGTYARAFEDFVAFGAKFPEGESVEHQKNEYIKRDDLLMMTQIYALAIRRCTHERDTHKE